MQHYSQIMSTQDIGMCAFQACIKDCKHTEEYEGGGDSSRACAIQFLDKHGLA